MKLLCLFIPMESQDEDVWEAQNSLFNTIVDAMDGVLGDQYFVGQDDGKGFIGIYPQDMLKVAEIYPRYLWVAIDSDDYPWDQNPTR